MNRFDSFYSGQYLNENLREHAEDWHTSIHVSRRLLKISISKIDRTRLTTALCTNPALKARTLPVMLWDCNSISCKGRNEQMLWTIFVILLVLWLVGLVSSYTMGGFIHLLLVLALIVLIVNLLTGRRTV